MSSSKHLRILAVLAIIFVVATTICIGLLCAAANAYSASKKQNIIVNVNGDNNNSSVVIHIEPADDNSTVSTDNIYKQLLSTITATITFATASLVLIANIIKIKNKQSE